MGPNGLLTAAAFPFHRLADPDDKRSPVIHDADDVVSSQGVSLQDFRDLTATGVDEGAERADPVFSVGGLNCRRVERRNAPTTINAIFALRSFWDGRADSDFNGVSPFGKQDPTAKIFVVRNGHITMEPFALKHSALASQAVGPPTSAVEMSFTGRLWPHLGKKLVDRKPLASSTWRPTTACSRHTATRAHAGGRQRSRRGGAVAFVGAGGFAHAAARAADRARSDHAVGQQLLAERRHAMKLRLAVLLVPLLGWSEFYKDAPANPQPREEERSTAIPNVKPAADPDPRATPVPRPVADPVTGALLGGTRVFPITQAVKTERFELRIKGEQVTGFTSAIVGIREIAFGVDGQLLPRARAVASNFDLANSGQAWLVGYVDVPLNAEQVDVVVKLDDFGAYEREQEIGAIDMRGPALHFVAPVASLNVRGRAVIRMDLSRSIVPTGQGAYALVPTWVVNY